MSNERVPLFLVRCLSKHGLTTSYLTQLDDALPNAVNELFGFICNFIGKTKMPSVEQVGQEKFFFFQRQG